MRRYGYAMAIAILLGCLVGAFSMAEEPIYIGLLAPITGTQAVGPSAIRMPTPGHEKARELSVSEIQALVDAFTNAAIRAKKAGFDAVEIHGAHPYLLAQFASAAWNKRQDEYGGELANRARLLIEIIKSIKQSNVLRHGQAQPPARLVLPLGNRHVLKL